MCDHVKQYKIPREYMFLSDEEKDDKDKSEDNSDGDSHSEDSAEKEAKARERYERKLYKPTGPDGQGWGDFRANND